MQEVPEATVGISVTFTDGADQRTSISDILAPKYSASRSSALQEDPVAYAGDQLPPGDQRCDLEPLQGDSDPKVTALGATPSRPVNTADAADQATKDAQHATWSKQALMERTVLPGEEHLRGRTRRSPLWRRPETTTRMLYNIKPKGLMHSKARTSPVSGGRRVSGFPSRLVHLGIEGAAVLRFIARRVVSGVVLVVVITAITFFLLYSERRQHRPPHPRARPPTNATVAQKAHELGLDKPLITQFTDLGLARGHRRLRRLLVHLRTRDVRRSLSRLAVTLSLVLGATVLSAVDLDRPRRARRPSRRLGRTGSCSCSPCSASRCPASWSRSRWSSSSPCSCKLFAPTGFVNDHRQRHGGWLSTVTLPIVALSLGEHRRHHAADPRLDARRAGPRLRPDAPQPRAVGDERRLQARPAERGRPRPRGAGDPVRRPPWRRGDRPSRSSRSPASARSRSSATTVRATSRSSWASCIATAVIVVIVNLDRGPAPGLPEPEGATRMTAAPMTPDVPPAEKIARRRRADPPDLPVPPVPEEPGRRRVVRPVPRSLARARRRCFALD